jgi:hypothetical protein
LPEEAAEVPEDPFVYDEPLDELPAPDVSAPDELPPAPDPAPAAWFVP